MPHMDVASVSGSVSSLWRASSSARLMIAEELDVNSRNWRVSNGAKLRKDRFGCFEESTAASCRRMRRSRMRRLRKEESALSLAVCPIILQRSARAVCSFSTHRNIAASNSAGGSNHQSQYGSTWVEFRDKVNTKYVTCNEE